MSVVIEKEKEYVTHAPPPIHSIITILLLIVFVIACLPDAKELDEDATIETFMSRAFPSMISLQTLIYTRILFSTFIFSITIVSVLPGQGWDQITSYLPGSKLRRTSIRLEGLRTMMPFTSWSWNLLGVSFSLNAWIAYQAGVLQRQDYVPPSLLRMALLLYAVAAPSTLLVSFVVTYAIWPNLLRQKVSTKNIKSTRTLIWHNANVMMALAESFLLGGIPVRIRYIAVAPMLGILYVLFTWYRMNSWKSTEGPQFIYFFFDTTLGIKTTLALLMLLLVMMMFYTIFAMAHSLLPLLGGSLVFHVLFVITVCTVVCRFKD